MSYEIMCKQLFWFYLCFCDKYHEKKQIRLGKGMFHSSLRTRSQQELKAETWREGSRRNAGSFSAFFTGSCLAIFMHDHLSRNGGTHIGMGTPALISNQHNPPIIYPQVNLIQAISNSRLSDNQQCIKLMIIKPKIIVNIIMEYFH